jgi:hypothetical protein
MADIGSACGSGHDDIPDTHWRHEMKSTPAGDVLLHISIHFRANLKIST